MTRPEACAALRVSARRLDLLLSAGVLTRVKEGRRTFLDAGEVAAYGERGPAGAAAYRIRNNYLTSRRKYA